MHKFLLVLFAQSRSILPKSGAIQGFPKSTIMHSNFKPEGYNDASPYFIVKDAPRFMKLMKQIFKANELRKYNHPDGSIAHAEMMLGDSVIMLGEASEKFLPVPIVMHVYVPNVDKTFAQAIEAGCEIVKKPIENEVDPDRRGTFKDYLGNMWSVGTQLPKG